MEVKVTPSLLKGAVSVPPSKSLMHRSLICAFLGSLKDGTSSFDITNVVSDDISATRDGLWAIKKNYGGNTQNAVINCKESGSTLRFLIPIVSALGLDCTFRGEGRLPKRPLDPYFREFAKKGITFNRPTADYLPFSMGGKLQSGVFEVEGDISSQFISGLLFALPLLEGDSQIVLTSPHESKPYTDMTLACVRNCGVEATETNENFGAYHIKGGQVYNYQDIEVEGDFSQAAFWLVANFLGSSVDLENISLMNSLQGDYKILEILRDMRNAEQIFTISAKNVPDLVPILAVAACFAECETRIVDAARLRLKESNRLSAISEELNKLGAKVAVTEDGLFIKPVDKLSGGAVSSHNDHRIAMALAIAATRANEAVTIIGAEAVNKSYPTFWETYKFVQLR